MGSKIYVLGAQHAGGEETIFRLRSISVAEENRYTTRFNEISDLDSPEKKSEHEYDILTDSIASWSETGPMVKIKGEETPAPGTEDAATPADAVRAYFAERDPDKERLAMQVVLQFRRKLQPQVVFY